MTYRELLSEGIRRLAEAKIAEPESDALFLLESAADMTRKDYLLMAEAEAADTVTGKFKSYIEKRCSHIPCQYITGKAYFMGHTFMVNENVLIPRQDTEILVEQALLELRAKDRVLDVCTGSGCIAISLKAQMPEAMVTAIDISEEALKVAAANAEAILKKDSIRNASEMAYNINFICSDLLTQLDSDGKFDLIVSNPPYVTNAEYAALDPEIRNHEPRLALLAGDDGLDIYKRLIPQARDILIKGGYLMLEIGSCQGSSVSELMSSHGFSDVRVVKDLAGLDRVIIGRMLN